MRWLLHVLGLDDATGRWYLWWSGVGSVLERLIELAVLGVLLLRRKRHVVVHHFHHSPSDEQEVMPSGSAGPRRHT